MRLVDEIYIKKENTEYELNVRKSVEVKQEADDSDDEPPFPMPEVSLEVGTNAIVADQSPAKNQALQTRKCFPCHFCGRKFSWGSSLKVHLKTQHGIEVDMSSTKLCCRICFQEFDSLALKVNHMKTMHPESRFVCRLCPRDFARIDDRIKHEMSAHGANIDNSSKVFRCEECKKVFLSEAYYAKHLQTHNK